MATKQKETKALSIEAKCSVILMEGDDQSDQASIRLSFVTQVGEGVRRSSGMVVEVDLPEGAIARDRDAARAEAKDKARKVLRKMLASVK